MKIEENMTTRTFYKKLRNWDWLFIGIILMTFPISEYCQNEKCSMFQREEVK